jgi:hypothetical protein
MREKILKPQNPNLSRILFHDVNPIFEHAFIAHDDICMNELFARIDSRHRPLFLFPPTKNQALG